MLIIRNLVILSEMCTKGLVHLADFGAANFYIWPKKKFVSCNPTLTSFIQKNRNPKVFSALPTPNQRKTCIKHTFLTKEIMQKKPPCGQVWN